MSSVRLAAPAARHSREIADRSPRERSPRDAAESDAAERCRRPLSGPSAVSSRDRPHRLPLQPHHVWPHLLPLQRGAPLGRHPRPQIWGDMGRYGEMAWRTARLLLLRHASAALAAALAATLGRRAFTSTRIKDHGVWLANKCGSPRPSPRIQRWATPRRLSGAHVLSGTCGRVRTREGGTLPCRAPRSPPHGRLWHSSRHTLHHPAKLLTLAADGLWHSSRHTLHHPAKLLTLAAEVPPPRPPQPSPACAHQVSTLALGDA